MEPKSQYVEKIITLHLKSLAPLMELTTKSMKKQKKKKNYHIQLSHTINNNNNNNNMHVSLGYGIILRLQKDINTP